jgi:hypothetical protein
MGKNGGSIVMKECYGNYMEYPICQGHYDVKWVGILLLTYIRVLFSVRFMQNANGVGMKE